MSFFSELKRRNVVRVAIAYIVFCWLLLQVVDFALDIIGSPNWIMQTLVVFAALGLPCVLAFAWVFELTPDGIKRDSEVPREHSMRPQTGYRLDRLTLVAVVVLVVFLVTNRNRNMLDESERAGNKETVVQEQIKDTPVAADDIAQPGSKPAASTAQDGYSIAVLPFVNMSSDPEQEYFSDGISEEILNVLSRIPQFKVAARTSSFQFKGQNQDIARIAAQLHVNHVLEGSVRKSGDKLRITAQLINAETGYHLWSETYDRELNDVFAIQDEISAAIASELEIQFAGRPLTTAQPVDLKAYGLYLKAQGLVASRQENQLLEAIAVSKQALDIAPDYAPAMATLAMAYAVLPYFSNQMPSGESRSQARLWSEKALKLDPDNDVALSALSIVLYEYDLDIDGALALLQKALEINPGSVAANNFLGDLNSRVGDFQNALKYESRTAELDPLGPVQWSDLAVVYIFLGDFAKSIEASEHALQLDPRFIQPLWHLADIPFLLGDLDALESVIKRVEAAGTSAEDLQYFTLVLDLAKDNKEAALKIFQQQVKDAEQGLRDPGHVAINAVVIGDFDAAGRLLLLAYELHDGTWTHPEIIQMPEQAPDSKPWQEFWSLPEPKRLAEKRRANGFDLPAFKFGAAKR